jgi:hypothetical protein
LNAFPNVNWQWW